MYKKILAVCFISLLSNISLASNNSLISNAFSTPIQSEGVFSDSALFKKTQTILPANEAFQPILKIENDELLVNFNVLEGYYLYKNKFKIKVNGKDIENSNVIYPLKSVTKDDDIFGRVEVYEYNTTIKTKLNEKSDYNVSVSYQGCAETYKVCYPEETINEELKNPNPNVKNVPKQEELKIDLTSNDSSQLTKIIENKSFVITSLTFFGIGLLLCFSPCVFPTLPLMSGLVIGSNKNPLLVSSFYGLGFITSYAMIGLIIDLFSINLQLAIQKPIFIISSAILFIALGVLTLFSNGSFGTQHLSSKIDNTIRKINNKNLFTTFGIGFLSSLILSPCAVAPLGATLIFISQQNQLFYGMWLLSILALGMILPLVLMSTFLKKIMPKTGQWLYDARKILGFLLFGFALYTLSRYISESLFNYILICIIGSLIIMIDTKILKVASFILSVFIFSMLNPTIFEKNSIINNEVKQDKISSFFQKASTTQELDNIISDTEKNNKDLIVYVGADWCISCQEMEAKTFSDHLLINYYKEQIKNGNNKVFVKIDITELTPEKKKMLGAYNLQIAPYFVIYKQDINKKLNINEISVGYLESSGLKKIL